jgi:hypothetical protein
MLGSFIIVITTVKLEQWVFEFIYILFLTSFDILYF